MVPSSALLDPWSDSYSGESRKVTEEREGESGPNQIQRRHGVWDPSAEPEAETEGGGWGMAEGERPNNRHRRRRRRRRLKRSPVHHQYGGRGVHRGAHPEHYATRYVLQVLNLVRRRLELRSERNACKAACSMIHLPIFRSRQATGYAVSSPVVPTSSVPSSRTRMRQQSPAAVQRYVNVT